MIIASINSIVQLQGKYFVYRTRENRRKSSGKYIIKGIYFVRKKKDDLNIILNLILSNCLPVSRKSSV